MVSTSAKPQYECFYNSIDGSDAEDEFKSSDAEQIDMSFVDVETGSHRVGSRWSEKRVSEHELCVATSPVVPRPRTTYRCYRNIGPVSGGN